MGFPSFYGMGQSSRLNGAGNQLPTFPANTPSGALFIYQWAHRNTTPGISATVSMDTGLWSLYGIATNNSSRVFVFTRRSTGIESGTFTMEIIGAGTYTNHGTCYAITSVTSTNAIDSSSFTTGAAGTVRNDASVTAHVDNSLAINLLFNNNAVNIGPLVGATGGTWVVGATVSGGGDCRIGLEYASITSAGTIIHGGTLTQTSGQWTCLGFAVRGTDLPPTTISTTGVSLLGIYGGISLICPVGL